MVRLCAHRISFFAMQLSYTYRPSSYLVRLDDPLTHHMWRCKSFLTLRYIIRGHQMATADSTCYKTGMRTQCHMSKLV